MSDTYDRMWRRYQRFCAEHSEPGRDSAAAFLGSLLPSQARIAKAALKAAGIDGLDRVPVAPYHRNEMRLRETILTENERIRLVQAAREPRDRAFLQVLYVLRLFEAAQLRWRDFDMAEGLIYVQNGKGGKSAWTVMPEATRGALAAWSAAAPAHTPNDYVFPNPDGGRLSIGRAGERVSLLLRRAGLQKPGRRAHALRRTFATEYLRQYPDRIRQLQVLMRHSQLQTTILYDYARPEEYRQAVAGLRL